MKRANRNNRPAPVFAALALLSALAGCGKVTQENYDKLKMGMDYAEVAALLGEPVRCESLVAFKSCVWGKEGESITVRLVADKVVLFESEGLKP